MIRYTAGRQAVPAERRGEMGAMRAGGWRVALATVMVLPGMGGAAPAQELARSPEQIRGCLCQERSLGALNTEVQNQSRLYEDKRQAFQQLDKEVQTARPKVNVNDRSEVDAFKRLLERRDAAADTLAGEATRNYSDAVTRYNQAVAAYNGGCAGKAYDPDQLAELRRNLSCPAP
jgi:hypothetical protein